jgi:hypothetical protein
MNRTARHCHHSRRKPTIVLCVLSTPRSQLARLTQTDDSWEQEPHHRDEGLLPTARLGLVDCQLFLFFRFGPLIL